MLKHSLTYFVEPNAFHLGDLINIIQRYQSEPCCMFSDMTCPCCNANVGNMIQFILSLFDTHIRFLKPSPNQKIIHAVPMWFKKHIKHPNDYKPYAKAKILPEKRKHIVCQFDGRSNGNKRPPDNEIEKILKRFPNIINIGDHNLNCKNRTNLNLKEKFNLIASARHYIGIDSGLTHLALMTNTPVHVIHPVEWHVRRYYPKSKQIKFSTSAEGLIQKI